MSERRPSLRPCRTRAFWAVLRTYDGRDFETKVERLRGVLLAQRPDPLPRVRSAPVTATELRERLGRRE